MNRQAEVKEFLPLSPAALHILLALAGEDLHGYGIILEVARQSNDQYKLGPGTLYDNLKKLMVQGLVEEVQKRERAAGGDSRRRYYRLTALGRRVLAAEVARLETVVRDARGLSVGSETKESLMPLLMSRALCRMLLRRHPAEFREPFASGLVIQENLT